MPEVIVLTLANTSSLFPPQETAAGSEVNTPPNDCQVLHLIPFQVLKSSWFCCPLANTSNRFAPVDAAAGPEVIEPPPRSCQALHLNHPSIYATDYYFALYRMYQYDFVPRRLQQEQRLEYRRDPPTDSSGYHPTIGAKVRCFGLYRIHQGG
jgi:hypothetical protein